MIGDSLDFVKEIRNLVEKIRGRKEKTKLHKHKLLYLIGWFIFIILKN